MRSSVFSKSLIPHFLIVSLYLFIKHDALNIRVSDTNIYFYTALELLTGKSLYSDIFFTNLPLFPYISVLYGILTNWRLEYFFAIPIIETVIISILVYKISFIHSKNTIFSHLSAIVYLFSFMTLATSDHQTGVFIANIFSLTAYYLFLKKKNVLAGIFLTLTIFTKIYFIPIPIALILYLFFKNRNECMRLTISFITSSILLLLLFFISSNGEILKSLFTYSSERHQGISKIPLLQFFAFKDFIIFSFLIMNLYLVKSRNFFGFLSFFSVLLIILYQDIYYLYLNFFLPFIAISISLWISRFSKNTNVISGCFVIILISLILNISTYLSSFKDLQKIDDIKTITSKITEHSPNFLYGINTITPALSYLSGVPMLDDIVDTNENRFLTGNLNAPSLTKKALSNKTLFVTKSAVYPEYQINEIFMSSIFDERLISECTTIYTTPVDFEGIENTLSLVTCNAKPTDEDGALR